MYCEHKGTIGVMSPRATGRRGWPADHRKLGERRGTASSLHSPREKPALLTPSSRTSGLKDCEKPDARAEATQLVHSGTAALGNVLSGKEKEE